MKKKILLFIALFLPLVAIIFLLFYKDSKKEQDIIKEKLYYKHIKMLRNTLTSLINEKKEATLSLAIALSSSTELYSYFNSKNRAKILNQIPKNLRKYTRYKNVWIALIDKDGNYIFQSWSNSHHIKSIDKGVKKALETKKIYSYVGIDRYGLEIKALVPIFKDDLFLGLLQVSTHINSISKTLNKMGIKNIFLVDSTFSKNITHAFSNHFLQNCYIANLNPDKKLIKHLKTHKIEKECFSIKYKIKGNDLVAIFKLKNPFTKKSIAHVLLFENISKDKTNELNIYTFKIYLMFILLFLVIITTMFIFFIHIFKKQKEYYKTIIDKSTNIIIITDNEMIIDANRAFFNYFNKYKTLDDFHKKHKCLCEFFIEEDGYVKEWMNGKRWQEYIYKHQKEHFIAKISTGIDIYYFSINVSKINETNYAIILTDITKIELYKQQLKDLATTDEVTGLFNRHFFEQKISEEINRAKRYDTKLSFMMADIDHFKSINDTYGHEVGDKVLKNLARVLKKSVRVNDIVCRVGGEEFFVILPETDLQGAILLAEKLRKKVKNSSMNPSITISLGVTTYKKPEDKLSVYKRVDNALYKAKENGRDRVEVAY